MKQGPYRVPPKLRVRGLEIASRPAEVGDEGLPSFPKARAWVHTLDNTEGLRGDKPHVVLTSAKTNPFGQPGIDYSKSFPVTSDPLFTAEQCRQGQRDAVAADRARMLRQVLDCYSPDDTVGDYQNKIRALGSK